MQKWNRFQYLPVRPLGKDGRMVTGSSEHIRLSRTAAAEGMVLLKNEHQLLPLRDIVIPSKSACEKKRDTFSFDSSPLLNLKAAVQLYNCLVHG